MSTIQKISMFAACALLSAACATVQPAGAECSSVRLGDQTLPSEVLIERVGVAEAEARNMRDGVPFGPRNKEWNALKREMIEGDEVWLYRDNRTIAGAEGYVLVRDCEVVAFVMTVKY